MKDMRTRIFLLLMLFSMTSILTRAQLPVQPWEQVTLSTFEEFKNTFNGNVNKVQPLQKEPRLFSLKRSELIQILLNPARTEGRGAGLRLGEYANRWNILINAENTVAEVSMLYRDVHGKEVPVVLQLKEVPGPLGSRWIVTSAESPIFSVGSPDKVGSVGVTNNEVGFMEFGHNAGGNPVDIAGDAFKADNVSIFLAMTTAGFIKYEGSVETNYYITLDNYRLKVGQVIDPGQSIGGWLILEIYEKGKKVFG